jgi:hypothetical protein
MGKMGNGVAQAIGIGFLVLILFRATAWLCNSIAQVFLAIARSARSLNYWSEEAAIAAGVIFLILIVLTDKKR